MAYNGTRTAQQILGIDAFESNTNPNYSGDNRTVDNVATIRADEHADLDKPSPTMLDGHDRAILDAWDHRGPGGRGTGPWTSAGSWDPSRSV